MVQPIEPREAREPKNVTDIILVGTEVARTVRTLPEMTSAPKPPVIQFAGVTSIMTGKTFVDTDIYTNLLRDRLLTGADNKVRYMERQLPPLKTVKKKKKKQDVSEEEKETGGNPDYELLAELQGNSDASTYLVQVQLLNVATSTVVFDKLYRILKETPDARAPGAAPIPGEVVTQPAAQPMAQ